MEALQASFEGPPPTHVAIIMDGNGRWAQARGLPRTAGHRRGAEAARRTVKGAIEFGISYLTLFGFSSENWRRPVAEVSDLMGLLRWYLTSELAELQNAGVRLKVIGERERLPRDIVTLIEDAEAQTAKNRRLNLSIALSYGSRQEIVAAAKGLARDAARGLLDPESIDEASFARRLFTADVPDPDLIIRTSGEQRLSNFLLWQCAYSEFIFMDTLWPDFDAARLAEAIRQFQSRERRYGASEASL